jgi:hypothetical protein
MICGAIVDAMYVRLFVPDAMVAGILMKGWRDHHFADGMPTQ